MCPAWSSHAEAAHETGGSRINLMGMEITPLIISRIEKNQRHVCDGELLMLSKALGDSMEWLCGVKD